MCLPPDGLIGGRRGHALTAVGAHEQSGRARAVWTDAVGIRQQVLLPGGHDTPESRTAFAKFQLELAVTPFQTVTATPATVSVNEVLLAHLDHAERHYRRADGTMTREVDEYRLVCRYVRELYDTTPAAGFGPLALNAVRRRFIAVGWCRSLVNQRVGRVRRVFKWAVENELVSPVVLQALIAVGGLQEGRMAARETAPILPVSDATVDSTLPHLRPAVRARRICWRWTAPFGTTNRSGTRTRPS